MSKHRRQRREQLEYYLIYLILAYRPLILTSGLLVLAFAIVGLFMDSYASLVILIPAICLLLMGSSYNVALYAARLGAWIGTLGGNDDR